VLIFFYPRLQRVADPLGTLASIEESTISELDLRNEARGQQTLRTLAAAAPIDMSRLRFPALYPKLSDNNIMVSEFIAGTTLDEQLAQGSVAFETLFELFRIHGWFLFCAGTFHGDIHPGNIICRDATFYFMDTGAISTVDDTMRRGLFRFFMHLTNYDYPGCCRAMATMSQVSISEHAFARFSSQFNTIYRDFKGKSVSEASLTRTMMQTIKCAVHNGMTFATGMYPIIKSLMYLDGMVLRCAPQTDLIARLKPFVHEFEQLALQPTSQT
jgi:ubiquinone biosynthesis protein